MDNNKVADVIQTIADKLGIAGVHLWPEMIRYTWANALAWLIFQMAFVLFALVLISNRIAYCKRILNDDDFSSDTIVFVITSWRAVMIVIGFAGVILAINIPDNISKVVAPEGATVMQMLKAASGK